MANIRKQKGKWFVQIRKKGHPAIYKSFHDIKTARKFARTVEFKWSGTCLEIFQGQEELHRGED